MKFKGIIPAMITPFNEDSSLFIKGLENEINYLYLSNFKNVFVCGSYGSFPLLDTDERKFITSVVTSLCRERSMKTIVHIGSPSTRTAIDLARHAEEVGADAISSVVPFYYSPTIYTEDTFLKYFEEVINSVSIDVHCYNNPNTTGYNVSLPFLDRLINIGLKGIKDGRADMQRIQGALEVIKDYEFDYYPSSTTSLISAFILGVASCTSGVALSAPGIVLGIYKNVNKNLDLAIDLYHKIMKVRSILGSKSGRAIAAYDVLHAKGFDIGTCRAPWQRLNKKEATWVIDELKKLGGII